LILSILKEKEKLYVINCVGDRLLKKLFYRLVWFGGGGGGGRFAWELTASM